MRHLPLSVNRNSGRREAHNALQWPAGLLSSVQIILSYSDPRARRDANYQGETPWRNNERVRVPATES